MKLLRYKINCVNIPNICQSFLDCIKMPSRRKRYISDLFMKFKFLILIDSLEKVAPVLIKIIY